jgi:hypothetical protein
MFACDLPRQERKAQRIDSRLYTVESTQGQHRDRELEALTQVD